MFCEAFMTSYKNDKYQIKIIKSHDEFIVICDEWDDALAQYDHKILHLESQYISALWNADDGKFNPHIIIIYYEQKIVGFAALDVSIYKYYFFPIKAAIPINQERYGRTDIVILRDEIAPIMHNAIANLDVDICHMDRLHSESLFLKYCEKNLGDKYYYPYEYNELAIINSRPSWDEYLSSKSKNFRRNYKRIHDAASPLKKILYDGPDIDIEKVINHIIQINKQSWKNDAGSDFSQDPKRMKFFRKLLNDKLRQKNLVVSLLYDDDKPVAYTFAIISGSKLYAIETGYIDEYADYNAGIISYIAIMKYAHDMPNIMACDMDTIRANGDYKKRWATHIEKQISAFILTGGIGSFIIKMSRWLSVIKQRS